MKAMMKTDCALPIEGFLQMKTQTKFSTKRFSVAISGGG
jgi:hypothetical protein